MSESKFTSGPWHVTESDGFESTVWNAKGTKCIAERIRISDAHLIASAPDMYEALKIAHAFLDHSEHATGPEHDAFELCESVLAPLVRESKSLDPEIQTLVQENFWELAGKPKAVELSGDARESVEEGISIITGLLDVIDALSGKKELMGSAAKILRARAFITREARK